MIQSTMRLYAGFGIACLFGGLWAGDSLALALPQQPATDFDMRIITFVFYLLFFGIVVLFSRRAHRNDRRFIMVSCLIVLALYGTGIVLLLSGAPSTLIIGLVLTKTLGAPLSVGLMCLCAAINRDDFPRVALLGLLCAFVLKAFLLWTISKGFAEPSGILLVSCTLVVVSFFVCILPFNYANETFFGTQQTEQENLPLGSILRPTKQLLTPSLIFGMIAASMLLGYLRSGIAGQDPHALRLVVFTLVIIIILGSRLRVSIPWIFNGAALFTAAGFLLGPSLALIIYDAPAVLCGIGSTLFETVMLTLVVWVTRNGSDPLRGAAGGLLAVITGHLCGALMAQASLMVFGAQLAFQESSLIIVFLYIVMLVFLFRNNSLHLPFFPQTFDDLEDSAVATQEVFENAENAPLAPPDQAPSPADQAAQTREEEPSSSPYWEQPCAYVAQTYQLTPRETEVLEQLARGRDLSFMEAKFMLSRNTIKMHVKHLYTKLDVHSKQEVIDLVEAARKAADA
ncbi:MAG: helix-turn-helix transcriptional regulator [Raoultibacter sp.]